MKKLKKIQNKIYSIDKLNQQLSLWRSLKKKIVFTNGCFDILHLGHIDYLSKAKDLGDILIVGINSDNSVRRIKKQGRPITNEISRSMIIAALCFTDAVVIFDEVTPYNIIKIIKPDILVKGSDYKTKDIVGYDIVKAKNGLIYTIDLLPGYSTTEIENKIKNGKKVEQ